MRDVTFASTLPRAAGLHFGSSCSVKLFAPNAMTGSKLVGVVS